MKREELGKVVELHLRWLNNDPAGVRANLRDADLRDADLRDADLRDANLLDANLRGANLLDANLWGANLWGANLRGANLQDADLRDADLWGANLRDANLRDADLRDADLWGADLRGADLRGADLRGADLRDATGNIRHVKSLHLATYSVTYTATHLQIGCKQFTFDTWWKFSDDKIATMDAEALDWWRVYKPLLQLIIEVSPAEPTKEIE
jgi:hypothetical protein